MGVPTLVLPGNPLLLMDDFEGYPVGAVLTAVAPKRYCSRGVTLTSVKEGWPSGCTIPT